MSRRSRCGAARSVVSSYLILSVAPQRRRTSAAV